MCACVCVCVCVCTLSEAYTLSAETTNQLTTLRCHVTCLVPRVLRAAGQRASARDPGAPDQQRRDGPAQPQVHRASTRPAPRQYLITLIACSGPWIGMGVVSEAHCEGWSGHEASLQYSKNLQANSLTLCTGLRHEMSLISLFWISDQGDAPSGWI